MLVVQCEIVQSHRFLPHVRSGLARAGFLHLALNLSPSSAHHQASSPLHISQHTTNQRGTSHHDCVQHLRASTTTASTASARARVARPRLAVASEGGKRQRAAPKHNS